MTDFVHLHVHGHNSLMDGLNSPEELLQAAKDLGHTALSLTDHGTLSGHREMQSASKALGMKPILGLEAYISPTDRFDRRDVKSRDDNTSLYNHLIILAKNQTGLRNLNKLSEIAWTEGYYYKPRIDKELLAEYKEGLIVLSGCMSGVISKAIERKDDVSAKAWMEWFTSNLGENFYIEIQPHNPVELNVELLRYADEFGVKPVVTSDCHYAVKEDRATEEALLILSTQPKFNKDSNFEEAKKIPDLVERFNYLWPDRPISFAEIDVYINGKSDIQKLMHAQGIERTDIYENTVDIADSVEEYEFNQGLDLLPTPKSDPLKRLQSLTDQGMKSRGISGVKEYEERLAEEIGIISSKNFIPYFLVVADMVNYAKNEGILVGPGRGSAAGSLVCYVLGITEVDPIKYGLLFGRFINEERNDFPDIDTDFEDRRRKEIKDYLVKKFKHVASISTFNKFADKGVVRDAARVHGVPLSEVNQALKTVETFKEYESSPNTLDFRNKYPDVTRLASKLRGHIRSSGMHAGGIVVAREPISKFAPIETRKDPNAVVEERIPVVALDMNEAADLGLIKLDVLGLNALSIISDTLTLIKERTGKDLNLLELDLADPKIYRDLSNGFTRAVFQADATPYTNMLIKMGVDNFEDLAASNALVRPGAANTVGSVYISRKKGLSQTEYVHDIVKGFTEQTYGVIIYQEQVMQTCVQLAGMSWAEADKIRKIIGKKKDVAEFEQYRERFVSGASKHITSDKAEELWKDFEAHSDYSFNRSHAVAYSMLSYWTAWLKHYYPLEFMCSALRNEGDKDARTLLFIETKRLGIKILLPHVNASDTNFTIEGDGIRMGLGCVKYLSEKTAPKILKHAPFKDYAELLALAGTSKSGINTRMVSSLNAIGGAAFDDNPRTGKERDNFYEYLNIPMFNTDSIPPDVKLQASKCIEFEEQGVFIIVGMVKHIKRGKGWSRVEMLDDSGHIGVFHTENTLIEAGKMYVFLIGDNRIHRYVEADEFSNMKEDPFVRYLTCDELENTDEKSYYVVDFTNYKTKSGKMMAHTIISKKNKEMRRVLVFNKQYPKALGGMRPGTSCEIALSKTSDGTIFVADVSRKVNA